jgi:hypothetical protein
MIAEKTKQALAAKFLSVVSHLKGITIYDDDLRQD